VTDLSRKNAAAPGAAGGLYAASTKIHPRSVKGIYRRIKTRIVLGLLTFAAIIPWLRWDRGPNSPDQAVLFDFVGMRGYFLNTQIWPQEFYFLTGILVVAAIGLFLVTALYGRLWCGFGCPQTIWTDIFVWVERQVEGDRNARIKLDRAPWSAGKVAKRTLKHALWIAVSELTAGTFVFYFTDAPTASRALLNGSAGPVLYGFFLFFTLSTYVMAGFAREQVCLYMCPWPRFQGAMIDQHTIIVGYDRNRGEGRAHAKVGESFEGRGHCVDCRMCVQVCPVGIDIRDGLQMDCIGCGLCVDACNGIMERFGLPPNLVGWRALSHESSVKPKPRVSWRERPRLIAYGAILAVTVLAMAVGGASRQMLDLNVLHDRSPVSVLLSDGSVRNDYTVKVINRERDGRLIRLDVHGQAGAAISVLGQDGAAPSHTLTATADGVTTYRVSIHVPGDQVKAGSVPVEFAATDLETGERSTRATVFVSAAE
jgi:cytochrome c oxidase accessory protein FixG